MSQGQGWGPTFGLRVSTRVWPFVLSRRNWVSCQVLTRVEVLAGGLALGSRNGSGDFRFLGGWVSCRVSGSLSIMQVKLWARGAAFRFLDCAGGRFCFWVKGFQIGFHKTAQNISCRSRFWQDVRGSGRTYFVLGELPGFRKGSPSSFQIEVWARGSGSGSVTLCKKVISLWN